MPVELTARLVALLAIALPLVAIGVDATAVAVLGALAALLALATALAPLRHPASRVRELDEALDRVERDIAAAGEEWAAHVTRAETAGRFREEFVASVRHELRTPLNAILGFADVLLEEVDGPLDPRQREDVAAIRDAGSYLSELVQAALSEWSPRHGTPLPIAYVDLAPLLAQVARILEGQLAGRPIAIRVDVQKDLRGPIADERRLRQILVNLGTNALRATERGEVIFRAREDGDDVRITVVDTGVGIEPDALPTLFAPFTQAGSARSRDGGAGLGLSIVREMVEWHGGTIEIESQRGVGTSISVLLRRSMG